MKTAIYVRSSRADATVEELSTRARDILARLGEPIDGAEIFVGPNGLERLLRLAPPMAYDRVYVESLDRLTRDPDEAARLIEELRTHGCQVVVFLDRPSDPD
jgi:DNA invertase Pin-like site-specific DNA recombinase